MQLELDDEQAETLRQILESARDTLQQETFHTDARAFRDKLHTRQQILEGLLARLASAPS
jgi:hypothetical protein